MLGWLSGLDRVTYTIRWSRIKTFLVKIIIPAKIYLTIKPLYICLGNMYFESYWQLITDVDSCQFLFYLFGHNCCQNTTLIFILILFMYYMYFQYLIDCIFYFLAYDYFSILYLTAANINSVNYYYRNSGTHIIFI